MALRKTRVYALFLGIFSFIEQIIKAQSKFLFAVSVAERNGLIFKLFGAHHEHPRDLLQLSCFDLALDRISRFIHAHAIAMLFKSSKKFLGIRFLLVSNSKNFHLNGGEPERKTPFIMFKQYA